MQFSTILAAIDLDDDLAEGVVRAAHSLAKKDGAALTVASVWPLASAITVGMSAEVAASSAVISQSVIEQHKKGRAEAEERLQVLTQRFAPGAKAQILDGDPADAIAEHADETHTDLIVTGSHQRGFWDTMLQGSASRELVKEAPCAVFLVTKKFAEKLKAGE